MKRESKYCPSCGRLKPEPVHEEIRATVTVLDRRCEGCGTQLGEIHTAAGMGWVCLSCYLRGVEGLLKAAA